MAPDAQSQSADGIKFEDSSDDLKRLAANRSKGSLKPFILTGAVLSAVLAVVGSVELATGVIRTNVAKAVDDLVSLVAPDAKLTVDESALKALRQTVLNADPENRPAAVRDFMTEYFQQRLAQEDNSFKGNTQAAKNSKLCS